MADNTCIFCRIVSGEIPSRKVYEDERVLAFHDVNPQAPVHVLIIPKTHVASCNEIGAENAAQLAAVLEAVSKVAELLGIAQDGYRVITNTGRHGCQSVPHLHFHVVGGCQLSEKMI